MTNIPSILRINAEVFDQVGQIKRHRDTLEITREGERQRGRERNKEKGRKLYIMPNIPSIVSISDKVFYYVSQIKRHRDRIEIAREGERQKEREIEMKRKEQNYIL